MSRFKMSNTMTPFLYQTGTLQRVARAGLGRSAALRAGLHTTARRARDEIPFELPPDLKATNPDIKDTITPTERQAFERIFREIADRGHKPKIQLPKSDPGKLKKEEPHPAASNLIAALQLGSSYDGKSVTKNSAAFNVNTIMDDAAMHYKNMAPGISGLDRLSPLDATYSAAEREKALLRFPPTLRRAARMAFGMFDTVQSGTTVQVEGGQEQKIGDTTAKPGKDGQSFDAVDAVSAGTYNDRLTRTVENEAQRRQERLAIKARMDACQNDFELWEVIEKQVFPLVDRLGLTEAPANSSFKPKRLKSKKKKAQAQEEPEIPPEEVKQTPAAPLDMEIYGPIYPQLLLEGLNLLDNKFARPSPYAMHLLPRIKQLGLVSYVLGVSTSFYNRLMLLLWNRYGDAMGVLNLLEEMKHAGLYFDENSRSVVSLIHTAYKQAEEGEKGFFVNRLMAMPEFEPILSDRLRHWTSNIDRSIKERRMGLGF